MGPEPQPAVAKKEENTKSYVGQRITAAVAGVVAGGCGAYMFGEKMTDLWANVGTSDAGFFNFANPDMCIVIVGALYVVILLVMVSGICGNGMQRHIAIGGLALGGITFSAAALSMNVASISMSGAETLSETQLGWTIGSAVGLVVLALVFACATIKCQMCGRNKAMGKKLCMVR